MVRVLKSFVILFLEMRICDEEINDLLYNVI